MASSCARSPRDLRRRSSAFPSEIITVKCFRTAGKGKAEIDEELKQRPVALQIVPRDAAYLFKPRGIYKGGAKAW